MTVVRLCYARLSANYSFVAPFIYHHATTKYFNLHQLDSP